MLCAMTIRRAVPVLLLMAAVAVQGCSTSTQTSEALVGPDGGHPAGFLQTHPGLAVQDSDTCRSCHGDALQGGISGVTCFTSSCHHGTVPNWADPLVHGARAKSAPGASGFASCQICHGAAFSGNAPAPACSSCHEVNAPHPAAPWRTAGGPNHDNTNVLNAPVCAGCHAGGALSPLPQPPPPPAGTPPGCFNNTLCHGAVAHPLPVVDPFLDPAHTTVTAAGFSEGCGACHAETGTSPDPSAPLCSVCHTNTAASPLTNKDCTSCHGNPPAGAAYPNFAGAHEVHRLLNAPGSPVACSTCHNGLGSGTVAHYDRANGRPGAGGRVQPGDAAFGATYDARTGAIAFDDAAFSCSNASCHGGQATPNWQIGAINVNVDCSSCHQLGTDVAGAIPQYNVYFSGQHRRHVVDEGIACNVCHATALLAGVHFDDLSTPAMTQARATLNQPVLNFNGSVTPPTCNPGCHGQESWTQQTLP